MVTYDSVQPVSSQSEVIEAVQSEEEVFEGNAKFQLPKLKACKSKAKVQNSVEETKEQVAPLNDCTNQLLESSTKIKIEGGLFKSSTQSEIENEGSQSEHSQQINDHKENLSLSQGVNQKEQEAEKPTQVEKAKKKKRKNRR